MKNAPVYTEFKPELIDQMLGLVLSIVNETRPIAGHSDPGAVEDCKNSLMEISKLVAAKARQAVEVEERLDKCIAFTEYELERTPDESITAKLLSKGRQNGYKFVKEFFQVPVNGKTYWLAKPDQLRNDLFWEFLTPDDLEIIRWSGYNDNNWWINVTKKPGQLQRKDKRGRVWTLDPQTDTVTLMKTADNA